MHSDNQVDFPQQFAPEQRQMLFWRQAQAAVCHHNLPGTSCHASRIPQMFLNCRKERGKKQRDKKRLKLLIGNWESFFASSLTWNGNTLPIKKVALEKKKFEKEQMKLDFQGQRKRSSWQRRVGRCLCLTLAVSKTMSSHWAFYEGSEPQTCSQNMSVDTKWQRLFVGKHWKGSEWCKLKRLV